MSENTQTARTAIVVSLASYRATRPDTRAASGGTERRLVALRLPSPRALAHRRRMLAHLASGRS